MRPDSAIDLREPPAPLAPVTTSTVRALVAHDWLVQYGGSERVVEEIVRTFPRASVLTTVHDPSVLPESLAGAKTTFLQKIPAARAHHEWFLPLMPLAWRFAELGGEPIDAVISSSHACAKAVRAPDCIPHVCYCHTPMRYAWDFASEAERFPIGLRSLSRLAMAAFRRWDRDVSDRVDVFVANSSAVADRIRRSYGRDAFVVHPPVRTDFFTYDAAVEREDFFLFVGRFVAYKRADAVIDAFRGLPHRLVVVGSGPQLPRLRAAAPANVTFAGNVSDDELRQLYRRARGFVYPANEDFGIAMAEAQSCGTPVVALEAGGARDIVDHGNDGVLIPAAQPAAIQAGVICVSGRAWDHERIASRGRRFSAVRFRREFRDIVEDAVATSASGHAGAVSS